jgi:hypothetical protein
MQGEKPLKFFGGALPATDWEPIEFRFVLAMVVSCLAMMALTHQS